MHHTTLLLSMIKLSNKKIPLARRRGEGDAEYSNLSTGTISLRIKFREAKSKRPFRGKNQKKF